MIGKRVHCFFMMSAVAWGALVQNVMADTSPTQLLTRHQNSYLIFESEDKSTRYWIDGRVQIDMGYLDEPEDDSLLNGSEVRRARFAIKTILYKDWMGEFDLDFSENQLEIKDLWIAYAGVNDALFKFGNHKPPFSMEEVTTSRWQWTMESSYLSAFMPGRRLGFSANYWTDSISLQGGFWFGEPGDDEDAEDGDRIESEQSGYALRGVFAPINNEDDVLHFGLGYLYSKPESVFEDSSPAAQDRLQFRTRPGVHFTDYIMRARVSNSDNYVSTGIEFAGRFGRFAWMSEYISTDVERFDGEEPTFTGYYAMVAYFLTPDQRPYDIDSGEFGAVRPSGSGGAWEVVFRVGNLDFNDRGAGFNNGKADEIMAGLNYFANNNISFKLHVGLVETDENAFKPDEDFKVYGLRVQYLF